MSEPPPILDYATPERQMPVYLVVILYIGTVIDVLIGAFLCFVAFLLLTDLGWWTNILILFLLLLLGSGLVVCGCVTFWRTNQMARNRVATLRRMTILVIVKEVFAWTLAVLIFVWMSERAWGPLLLPVVILAVAASVTRMVLQASSEAVKITP